MPDKMDVRSLTIEECAKVADQWAYVCTKEAAGEPGDPHGHEADANMAKTIARSIRSLPSAAVETGGKITCWRCGGCGELDASAAPCPACEGKGYHSELTALRKAGEGAVAWQYRMVSLTGVWSEWSGITNGVAQSYIDEWGGRSSPATSERKAEVRPLYAHPSPADRKAGEGAVLKGVSKLPWCVGEIESRHDGIGRVRSFTVEDADGRVVMDATNSSVAEIQSEHDGEPEGHVHHWDEQSRKDAHLIVAAVNAYRAHPSPAVPVGWHGIGQDAVAKLEEIAGEIVDDDEHILPRILSLRDFLQEAMRLPQKD